MSKAAAEGEPGLPNRSSRPHTSPAKTPVEVEQRVLELRRQERRGRDWLGPELGVPPRTVARILCRHRAPYLRECDPMSGR
ncbi:leucine zipper domain-containing protein [Nocardioides sp.]|uniref:leucine zipper domain-containing protein n=1 Tax=Nocardioides sp. TaxID=35761 RepID=UPI0034334F6A